MRTNCERINDVKTVKMYNRYGEKMVNGYGRTTGFFLKWS